MANGMGRPRVLWLHTQPEHYFNCMMDDLARGTPYLVGGMGEETGELAKGFQWVAGFSSRGLGQVKEGAVPEVAAVIFLRTINGNAENWRADLGDLRGYAAVIVSGYAWRAHREVIAECDRLGVPVAMFSDSNWKSQAGGGVKGAVRRWLKKVYLRKIVRAVDVQLTANSLGVEYWKRFGAAAEQIVVCPYYADYRRVDAAARRARAEVLGRVGLKAGDKVMMTAARLVRAKGIDLMVRAFIEGGFAEDGWRYVIAGMGEEERALKELAGSALGGSIVFAGFQQPAEVVALMAHSAVTILPSRYEPHGIVVAESLAAGTPVVASDVVGSAADLVEDGVNGRIFKSGHMGDLRRVLEAGGFEGMGGAARAGFERWYARTSPVVGVARVVERLKDKR